MSDPVNWENGYVPQAGDELDFSVMTATYKEIKQDIADGIQFETMTGFNISFAASDISSKWNFRHLTTPGCEAGGCNFFGTAHLNVAGKLTYTGAKSFFISDTDANDAGGVTAGEFEYTGPAGKHIFRAPHNNWGGIRAGTFIHNGKGHLLLCSNHTNADRTKTRYIVGSGGFTFGDTQSNTAGRYYYINRDNKKARTVRIDPCADYSFAANPTLTENMAIAMYDQCTLELGTSDRDDPTIPRTVTCIGGIGGYLNGTAAANVNIIIDGCGTNYFNSATGYNSATGEPRFPGTVTVKDTATIAIKDTAITPAGPVLVNSGATLAIVQTGTSGVVEFGGSVTLAADSIVAFKMSPGASAVPLRLNGLVLPESGTVKIDATGCHARKCTLIDNLPAGVTADKFEFAARPYYGAKLYVENNQLKMKPSGFTIFVK